MSFTDTAPYHLNKRNHIPRGEKRREEIAGIAQKVFLELGFAETTMQIIASRAGASKETLYRHFTSKEGLFAEVINRRSALVFNQAANDFPPAEEPKKTLLHIGHKLLNLFLGEDSLALCRLVVAEAPRAPELGRIFFEQGPAQITRKLTNYLSNATELGRLNCTNPTHAAELFLGSIVGNRHLMSIFFAEYEVMTEEKIQLHVEEAVMVFLARYGVPVQHCCVGQA